MGYGLKEPLNLTDFVMHLGTIIVGSSRARPEARARAAQYLRNVAFSIGRVFFLSRQDASWQALSLLHMGVSLGPSGQRPQAVSPFLKKEIVELTHAVKGTGVTKPSQLMVGAQVNRSGGQMKRGRALEDLLPPGKKPRRGSGDAPEDDDNGFEPSPRPPKTCKTSWSKTDLDPGNASKLERHYAWNYWLSQRTLLRCPL